VGDDDVVVVGRRPLDIGARFGTDHGARG
jgi:hypothetical protein